MPMPGLGARAPGKLPPLEKAKAKEEPDRDAALSFLKKQDKKAKVPMPTSVGYLFRRASQQVYKDYHHEDGILKTEGKSKSGAFCNKYKSGC